MDLEKNWFIRKNLKNIEILGIHVYDFVKKYSIPYKEYSTFIDWNYVQNKFEKNINFEGEDNLIYLELRNSILRNYQKLIIYIEYDSSLLSVNSDFFFDNWNNFNSCNGFTGFVVFTTDGKYYLEFTDDSFSKLFSNFKIG